MTKVDGIRKIMVLWQAVFLAGSPLVTAPPSSLKCSTILQRLRRQIALDYYTIPPATQAISSVGQQHAETIGLPGLPALWILGSG